MGGSTDTRSENLSRCGSSAVASGNLHGSLASPRLDFDLHLRNGFCALPAALLASVRLGEWIAEVGIGVRAAGQSESCTKCVRWHSDVANNMESLAIACIRFSSGYYSHSRWPGC